MKKGAAYSLLFLIPTAIKLGLNLSTKSVLGMDSWVMYHIVESILHGLPVLPRGSVYLWFPLSYLPLLGPAAIGTLFSLKFVYPLLTSLAAFPVYRLARRYLSEWRAFFAALVVLLIDDFVLRTLTVTPQGIGMVFLFWATTFLLEGRRCPFLVFAFLTLASHHLCAMVLAAFCVAWVLAGRSVSAARGHGDGGRRQVFRAGEPAVLSYLVAAAGYLALSAIASGKKEEVLILLLKGGIPLLAVLPLAFLLARRIEAVKTFVSSLPAWLPRLMMAVAVSAVFFFSVRLSTHSFLEAHGWLSALLVPLYLAAPVLGTPGLFKEKDSAWLLFAGILAAGFLAAMAMDFTSTFDAVRLLPFLLVPFIIFSFRVEIAPGAVLLALSAYSLVAHLLVSYGNLLYTQGELDAAQWARDHLVQATVATDARMSALFLGAARLSGTFEGTGWLFDEGDPMPRILKLNGERFRDYPIRYIATARYMESEGADISWDEPRRILTDSVRRGFDAIGRVVFDNGDVTIWELVSRSGENR